jgi:hypothetical protein
MPSDPKDWWDKADIILKPVGGLLTALSVAIVGYLGSQYLNRLQAQDTNVRLYAQLMSSRESSDSALRQQMFDQILSTFLTNESGGPASAEDQVLALELLTYNFHEALDLGPLFRQVHQRITSSTGDSKLAATAGTGGTDRLYNRLRRVALEVTGKQIATLEDAGVVRRNLLLLFEELEEHPEGIRLLQEDLTLGGSDGTRSRRFTLWALGVTPDRREVKVRLEVWPTGAERPEANATFSVGIFDFPMINNTRLPRGDRVAVVIENLAFDSAQIAVVYFPGSRASLKDKPFYDEVIEDLVGAGSRGSSAAALAEEGRP